VPTAVAGTWCTVRDPAAYTVETLATRCAVSPKAVRRWAARGLLPGQFRAGRVWRFDRPAVEKRLLGGCLLLEDTAHDARN